MLSKDLDIHQLDFKHNIIDLSDLKRPIILEGLFNQALKRFLGDNEIPIRQKHNPLLRALEGESLLGIRVSDKHFRLANKTNEY
jgi:hypothetical protein